MTIPILDNIIQTLQNITQAQITIIIAIVFGLFLIWLIYYLVKSSYAAKIQNTQVLNRKMMLVKVTKVTGRKEEEIRDSREMAILFAGVMEQLYSSLASIYSEDFKSEFFGQPCLTFEMATIDGEICFYVTCPKNLQSLVEKQIHGQYPSASIEEIPYYNPFKSGQKIAAAQLELDKKFVYPIKTYLKLESDSLLSISNTLSKIGAEDAAAIQIAIRPKDNKWRKTAEEAIGKIKTGQKSGAGAFLKDLGKTAAGKPLQPGTEQKTSQPESEKPLSPAQEAEIKGIQEKIAKVGFDTQIRIITAAKEESEAEAHLNNIISSFAQFNNPELNGFKKIKDKNKAKLILDFIFRKFGDPQKSQILNTEELASIFHFPNKGVETPNIKWLSAKDAPAPANLPDQGTLLGQSIYRGQRKQVKITDEDRRRHIYAIGKTGTGKTTLFVSMALSDIRAGKGVCYIDPHGDAINEILPKIPRERVNDVIVFNPADTQIPLGLNLLEAETPEQRDFIVQEAIQIFYKLFDPEKIGIVGPQWEHWMRNASLTLMADPAGGTLIEIPRLFVDKEFRDKKLVHVKDPQVRQFWEKQIAQTAEFHKSEMLNYFTSKFGRFITNEMMRNIIGQTKSGFDFRETMDEGKILLINLSKGMIGEVNSNLLGMICVAKLQMAAMSRADIPEEQRKDFNLYVDEFQNFATENFAQILSEARKYRLSLNLTNQYIAQLDESIRDAIFGNVGTILSFRIGAGDAEFLAKEFTPVFDQEDLINIDKYHAYIKLLINGVASKPFSMETIKDQAPVYPKMRQYVFQLSRSKYGKNRAEVEKGIFERAKIKST